MSITGWVNKEDLTFKEYSSLCPTYGLFKGVNFEKVKYYRDEDGKIYELSYCIDGSMNERLEKLRIEQKKKEIMKSFGL